MMRIRNFNPENWISTQEEIRLYANNIDFSLGNSPEDRYRIILRTKKDRDGNVDEFADVFQVLKNGEREDTGIWGFHYTKYNVWVFFSGPEGISRQDPDPRICAAKIICNI